MKTFVFLLLMLPLSAWTLESPHVSASRFCSNLSSTSNGLGVDKDSQTIEAVRSALGYKNARDIGHYPQNAYRILEKAGFKNYLETDSKLADETKIPIGAIFVLSKDADKNCPLKGKYGDLAVKCENNTLLWTEHQTKNLSQFVKENPHCIRAVLYLPSWTKTTRKEADAESLSGQNPASR
jgi:hypothetical protein